MFTRGSIMVSITTQRLVTTRLRPSWPGNAPSIFSTSISGADCGTTLACGVPAFRPIFGSGRLFRCGFNAWQSDNAKWAAPLHHHKPQSPSIGKANRLQPITVFCVLCVLLRLFREKRPHQCDSQDSEFYCGGVKTHCILVYRLAYNGDGVAFKIARRQGARRAHI